MDNRYKIVIVEIAHENKICGKTWEIGADTDNGVNGYGYTPEITKIVQVEREIYSQNAESLDLVRVIKAINLID